MYFHQITLLSVQIDITNIKSVIVNTMLGSTLKKSFFHGSNADYSFHIAMSNTSVMLNLGPDKTNCLQLVNVLSQYISPK